MVSVIVPSKDPKKQIEIHSATIEVINVYGGHFVDNCRRGLEQSRGRHVLYLNDDAAICLSTVQKMSRYLDDHPDVAIVGPRIIGGVSYGKEPSLFNALCDFFRLPLLFPSLARARVGGAKERDVDYVTGACLMARREYAEFNPAFVAYYEDVDLCKRARVAGMRVVYFPYARVIHKGGASYKGAQKRAMMRYGLFTYMKLWHGRLYGVLTIWLYEHRLFT